MHVLRLLLVTICVQVFVLIVTAYSLPVARRLELLWAWTYTAPVVAPFRGRRRREIESDVHEEIDDDRSSGYSNGEIAVRLVVRALRGTLDDLAWATPRLWPVVRVGAAWRRLQRLVGWFAAAALLILIYRRGNDEARQALFVAVAFIALAATIARADHATISGGSAARP